MIDIKDSDKFNFKGMVVANDSKKLTVNYVNNDNEKMTIVLEANTDATSMVGFKDITYGVFKKTFPSYRVYLQGYIEIEA